MIPEPTIINTHDGKYLIFGVSDVVTNSLKNNYIHERELYNLSEKILINENSGVVIDVGSNLGTFTIPLAMRFANLNFIAFEPQKIVYYQICANILLNRTFNVSAFNFALADEEKTIEATLPIYHAPTNIGAFSLDNEVRNSSDYESSKSNYLETFHLQTLDSLNIKNVLLIKIDVEGMELSVIKGGLNLIKDNNYPPIIFETWTYKDWYQPRRQELYNFLIDLGYNIRQIGENNLAQHSSRQQIDF